MNTFYNKLRPIHEVLFSLNTGLVGIEIAVAVAGWSLIQPFDLMEMHVNSWLQIRQADFVRGYFAFYVPSIVGALCIWMILRLTSSSKPTNYLLHFIAGPLMLLGMPAYWQYVAVKTNLWGWYGSQTWRYGASPLEAMTALAVILVFLFGKWPGPPWTIIPFLAMHFAFWTMPIHRIWLGGPQLIVPVVGFLSCSLWVFYVEKLKVEL